MPLGTEELVVCTTCKQPKPRDRYHVSKTKLNGLQSRCKDCKSEHGSDYKKRGGRSWYLRSTYGITPQTYAEMLFLQGGVCKICSGVNPSGKELCVDHDHKTGAVRGLLCSNCNTAIGLLREDPELLARAAEYLGGN